MFTVDKIQSFNELEMMIYNYIIKNGNTVIYMRIRELADEVHVSTTTILRFCKKIDCEGFAEFKVKLKLNLKKEEDKNLTDNTNVLIDFLKKSENNDFKAKINEVIDIINNTENLMFSGIGFSGILAKYAARYISAIGKFATYLDDPFFPTTCKNFDEEKVIIVLSVSGETDTIIHQVNNLKKEGCTIISITNNENCTLAKISNINISYYIQMDKCRSHNITTQIPVMHLIESIGKGLHNYRIENNLN